MRDKLIEAMEEAARQLGDWPDDTVHLFHHNDADGLSSGAILTRAFERKGYTVVRSSLEKPYPEVLERIFRDGGRILVFTDFAGRIAPLLSDLNKGRNLTLILDHHVAAAATDPLVHNLDPDLYGMKGDRDISASTTCYLFALVLDEANRDLAHVAAMGAVGDGFFVGGRLAGENREAALEAARQGRMAIEDDGGGAGERYVLDTPGGGVGYGELTENLSVLGAAGYNRGGPDMGVRVCLEGASAESEKMLAELQAIRASAFDAEIARLRGGSLTQSRRIQWFHVERRFAPMGVKMIGTFSNTIRDMDFVDPEKYIAGFQVMADEVPGFGPIEFNQVKISMRVPTPLEARIKGGEAMGLDAFLPEATNRLGGFSDACHSLTAATTVAIGKEAALIREMEEILAEGGEGGHG